MNIIITGASRGIGYECAKLFALNPENQVLAIARSIEGLDRLQNEINILLPGNQLHTISFDLSEIEHHSIYFAEKVKRHFDHIDILINNAGLLVNNSFVNTTSDVIHLMFQVNVFSVMELLKCLYSLCGGNKRTHIVNIGSMGGVSGTAKFSGLSIYSASKAALGVFTECIAEEFKDKNIRANCLALGSVQTEMLKEAFPGYKSPVEPSEMASFIYDFALNGDRYFNGKILPVSLSTP
jgi:short-subunit dehydrogenase